MTTQGEFRPRPRCLAGAGEIGRVRQPLVQVHGWPPDTYPARWPLACRARAAR